MQRERLTKAISFQKAMVLVKAIAERWQKYVDNMMEEHPSHQHVTDQELVAGVFIALLYVHGLDLSVGDAGTVLVRRGEEHR